VESRARVSAPAPPGLAVLIRRATAADAAEIARLGAQFAGAVDGAQLRACIVELQALPAYYLAVAAESATRLRGWIQVERRLIVADACERAEIMGLVVDEAARRRGIGTQLVRAAQQWALAEQLPRILVRSNIVREASHIFYARLGFSRAKTQHVYWSNTDVAAPV
jgi:GNAT superfamily N-acetyltransferase